MADIKISELPAATTPLTGAELVPVVQSGATKQTTLSNAANYNQAASIAALRLLASTGAARPTIITISRNYVAGDGGGAFRLDSTDTSSADNNGTIIVDAAGNRWKRQWSGPVNANWFGNLATGFTAAVQSAITVAGTYGTIEIPYGSYTLTATLTLLTGQSLVGIGGRPTITRAFAGTMINASAVATNLTNLDLRGAGATYTNTSTDLAVLYSNGSNFYQSMNNVWIYDSAGPCVSFSVSDAASKSKFVGCNFQRTTTTNAAVVMPTVVDTIGYREFYDCRGDGSWLLRFNSSINTKIIGGDCVNLDFSGSEGISLRAVVNGVRIATGGGTFTLYGNDSAIVGCIIAGPGVITGAASRNNISGNVLQAGQTWTDNSTSTGTDVNTLDYASYTPAITWGADGTQPVLGNGTLSSRVVRQGRTLAIDIFLNIGSTTTFGTSNWYFEISAASLPPWNANHLAVGTVRIFDSGTSWFIATAWVAQGTRKIYMSTASSGNQINPSSPMTWASGDSLALHIEYEIS
jgi:hypothetical protein